ncbi:orotidine-5'-phosphate decarboxylase [Fodinicola feengrottensis]|uniref:Orotidine 5'-phosphate decarboxylase n=1 Tax=Fodinicola feengrottensis TaxID=435914 RepID=A0ABN2HAT2_9ACTN
MSEPFGTRLRQAMDKRGPLCVGIDPHAALLAKWGLPDNPVGLAAFADTVIDAIGDLVPVVKPQSAFFERHGSAGIAVLERLIGLASQAGALVLLDVKRGDIGSTAAGYADAYLRDGSSLAADAITVSPFLGVGSLDPVFDTALEYGRGVFVLALTSNPEAPSVQHARTPDGRTVAQAVLDDLAVRNAGATPLGSIGAVVGATIGQTGHDLTRLNGPFLAPGIGAQGGTPEGLRAVFGDALSAVLPAVSREVLAAGPSPEALRKATEEHLQRCVAAVTRG